MDSAGVGMVGPQIAPATLLNLFISATELNAPLIPNATTMIARTMFATSKIYRQSMSAQRIIQTFQTNVLLLLAVQTQNAKVEIANNIALLLATVQRNVTPMIYPIAFGLQPQNTIGALVSLVFLTASA